MTSSDTLTAFLEREAGYELCAALLPAMRTRQDLLEMIAVSPRTIDRRLTEAQDHSLIQREPTTDTELLFSIQPDALPNEHLGICETMLDHHAPSDTPTSTVDPAELDLHRNNLDREQAKQGETHLVHANVAGGASRFFRQ